MNAMKRIANRSCAAVALIFGATILPAQTISVSPKTATVAVGSTKQLSRSITVAWSSSDTTVATVSSTGLVTAKRPGTAIISVTAGGPIARSTITVPSIVVVAPPPPAPEPTPVPITGSNEPAGLTVLSDRPFNTTIGYTKGEGGWWDYPGGGLQIVLDATASKSPSNVARITFAAGIEGGYAPGGTELPVDVTTLYVATWIKYSSNWQSHSSGVNKILHLWIGGGNHVVITAAGYDPYGPLTARISLQGIVSGGNNSDGGISGTYESNVQFIRGQWHKIEVVAIASGSVKLYIDGALATECSGINFGGTSFSLVAWSPTWGGTGDHVVATQYEYMDHVYVSGKR